MKHFFDNKTGKAGFVLMTGTTGGNLHTCNVFHHAIVTQTPATTLTKWQRRVCRWFKITPEILYWFRVHVIVDKPDCFAIGDMVFESNNHIWFTITNMSVAGSRLILDTLLPLLVLPGIKQLQLAHNQYHEGQTKPNK